MEKGQKVRVVDNGNLSMAQQKQLGKKGKVEEVWGDKTGAYIAFKSGVALAFSNDKLELVTNRHPFDLERALKGDEVVTRKGLPVTKVEDRKDGTSFPVRVYINGSGEWVTRKGRFDSKGEKHEHDLFMKHPAKPQQQTIEDELTTIVLSATPTPNLAFDDNQPVTKTVIMPEYDKLKSTFINMLECYTMALKVRGSDKEAVKTVWMKEAGI